MNDEIDDAVEAFEGFMRVIEQLPCSCNAVGGLCGACLSTRLLTSGAAKGIVHRTRDISPDLPIDEIQAMVEAILEDAGREGTLQ